MAVSHKDWGTAEFTKFIGWYRYWKRARFSRLDRDLDRLCFAVKKLQTTCRIQIYWLFSSNNDDLFMEVPKVWWLAEKKGRATSSLFASKMSANTKPVKVNEINCSCCHMINFLSTEQGVCMEESLTRSALTTSVSWFSPTDPLLG